METSDIILKLKKSVIDKCRDRIEESHNDPKEDDTPKEYGITQRLKNKRLF